MSMLDRAHIAAHKTDTDDKVAQVSEAVKTAQGEHGRLVKAYLASLLTSSDLLGQLVAMGD